MVDVIIVAAGSGKRMGYDINKAFIEIDSKPILAYTIEHFYQHKRIDNITIAIRKEDETIVKALLDKYGYRDITLVYGGKERQDSIKNCLDTLGKSNIVMIHDAARPFINSNIIDQSIDLTEKYEATCLGVPIKDTVKVVDQSNTVKSTPDRSTLWSAQTPQTFKYDLLISAYNKAFSENISATDDSSLVESLGYNVKMIMGSYQNIKITTPEDLKYAQFLIESSKK